MHYPTFNASSVNGRDGFCTNLSADIKITARCSLHEPRLGGRDARLLSTVWDLNSQTQSKLTFEASVTFDPLEIITLKTVVTGNNTVDKQG